MKQKALQIFLAGVNNVLPDKLIRTKLLSESYIISKAEKIYVFAIGKAAFLMVKGVNDLDKIDVAQKEIDILLDQTAKVMESYIEKSIELNSRYIEIADSVLILNQPIIAKLESSTTKDQIYKQLHKNRMNSYKQLDAENRENIKFLIYECEKLATVINELDYYSIDGHRVSYNKTGLSILQDIYKSMEWAFHFNAGNGEEIDPFDSALMMQQMFKGKK